MCYVVSGAHTHTTHMRPTKASMCACIQGDAAGMPSCKSIQRIMNHTFYTIVLKKRDSCTCTQRVVSQGDRADSPLAGACLGRAPWGATALFSGPTQHHQPPRCTGDAGSAAEVESHSHQTPPPTAKRHRADQFGCPAGCPGQGSAPGGHALPVQPSARARQISRRTADGGGTCRPKACRPVAPRSP